jgi:hypothetical protein
MAVALSRTKRIVSLLVLGLIVTASALQTEVANVSSNGNQKITRLIAFGYPLILLP